MQFSTLNSFRCSERCKFHYTQNAIAIILGAIKQVKMYPSVIPNYFVARAKLEKKKSFSGRSINDVILWRDFLIPFIVLIVESHNSSSEPL
ncbi:CLUMA_CG001333, isoform A [Clunio marinus]|uniref:CLUMA_CG001333, isoform A n=1 Tax=Clunio marinus TaxID=568069 RepID=A0A1J1HHQ4_9DIPT|nr:CLUMA_CG001333, isoform A [Clunio marinus]